LASDLGNSFSSTSPVFALIFGFTGNAKHTATGKAG